MLQGLKKYIVSVKRYVRSQRKDYIANLRPMASMMEKYKNFSNEEMRLKLKEMRLLQQKQGEALESEIAKVETKGKVCVEYLSNEGYFSRD